MEKINSINPATLETVGQTEQTPPEKIEEIVLNAHKAFLRWRGSGLDKRSQIIKEAQQLLLAHKENISRLITLEMGRPINESLALEVSGAIDIMGYYAKRANKFLDDRKIPLHHMLFKRRKSYMYFEPLGVLGIISPWNWPLLIPIGIIVPALLSGNTVIFKPSEFTPLTGQKIRDIFIEAGVPEHSFQIVQGGAAQGQALINAGIEKIFFTGSTGVGHNIFKQCACLLMKNVLEMGGSDPAIVCEDADLDITSSGLIWGGFCNCGQNCNSIEHIYLNEKIEARLITLLIEKTKQIRSGNGLDNDTDMGPLGNQAQLEKMEDFVKQAQEKGAKVLCGGKRINKKGYFFEPTLILWDKSIPQPVNKEIFGPIVLLTPVKDDDEAIALANHSTFGLASSIWTGSKNRGEKLSRRIEAGTVMINDVIVSFGIAEAGWTGIKNSGLGWVHGEKGLDEMVNIKYINRDPQSHTQKLWWFPYTTKMLESMKKGLDLLFSKSISKRIAAIPGVLKSFASYLFINRKKKDKM